MIALPPIELLSPEELDLKEKELLDRLREKVLATCDEIIAYGDAVTGSGSEERRR